MPKYRVRMEVSKIYERIIEAPTAQQAEALARVEHPGRPYAASVHGWRKISQASHFMDATAKPPRRMSLEAKAPPA